MINKKFQLNQNQISKIIKYKEKHLKENKTYDCRFYINFKLNHCEGDNIYIRCYTCNPLDFDEVLIHDHAYERKEKYQEIKNLRFTDMIFCGNGEYSQLQCDRLHQRLDYAISELSGDQQNGGMGSDYNYEYHDDSIKERVQVVEDMIIALGLDINVKLSVF